MSRAGSGPCVDSGLGACEVPVARCRKQGRGQGEGAESSPDSDPPPGPDVVPRLSCLGGTLRAGPGPEPGSRIFPKLSSPWPPSLLVSEKNHSGSRTQRCRSDHKRDGELGGATRGGWGASLWVATGCCPGAATPLLLARPGGPSRPLSSSPAAQRPHTSGVLLTALQLHN